MPYQIENIFYFEEQGPSVLVEIQDISEDPYKSLAQFTFVPMNNKIQRFHVCREGLKYAEKLEPCLCKFTEYDDLRTLYIGDDVFVWHRGSLEYGEFLGWENDYLKIKLACHAEETYSVKKKNYEVVAYSHSFEPIKGTTVSYCKRCEAVHAPKRQHTV